MGWVGTIFLSPVKFVLSHLVHFGINIRDGILSSKMVMPAPSNDSNVAMYSCSSSTDGNTYYSVKISTGLRLVVNVMLSESIIHVSSPVVVRLQLRI